MNAVSNVIYCENEPAAETAAAMHSRERAIVRLPNAVGGDTRNMLPNDSCSMTGRANRWQVHNSPYASDEN